MGATSELARSAVWGPPQPHTPAAGPQLPGGGAGGGLTAQSSMGPGRGAPRHTLGAGQAFLQKHDKSQEGNFDVLLPPVLPEASSTPILTARLPLTSSVRRAWGGFLTASLTYNSHTVELIPAEWTLQGVCAFARVCKHHPAAEHSHFERKRAAHQGRSMVPAAPAPGNH